MQSQSPRISVRMARTGICLADNRRRFWSIAIHSQSSWRRLGKIPVARHRRDHVNTDSRSSKVALVMQCFFMITANGMRSLDGAAVRPGSEIAKVSTLSVRSQLHGVPSIHKAIGTRGGPSGIEFSASSKCCKPTSVRPARLISLPRTLREAMAGKTSWGSNTGRDSTCSRCRRGFHVRTSHMYTFGHLRRRNFLSKSRCMFFFVPARSPRPAKSSTCCDPEAAASENRLAALLPETRLVKNKSARLLRSRFAGGRSLRSSGTLCLLYMLEPSNGCG